METIGQQLQPLIDVVGLGWLGLVVLLSLAAAAYAASSFGAKPRQVLDPVEWRGFKLDSIEKLSHNTAKYRFALPRATDSLGLPIGQHISVAAEIEGKQIVRSYTPTTLDDDKGHFDLVVKTYEKGNISMYLSKLSPGQKVRIKGPKGKFVYTRGLTPHMLMIAGGTGLTPMYQIIKASLKDPKDTTKLCLIYANISEEDILLKKELDELRDNSNGRFTLYYVLNSPPPNWTGGTGFVTREMIESHMPSTSPMKEKVLMCGPPPMLTAMKVHLTHIGYPAPRTVSKLEDQVFCF